MTNCAQDAVASTPSPTTAKTALVPAGAETEMRPVSGAANVSVAPLSMATSATAEPDTKTFADSPSATTEFFGVPLNDVFGKLTDAPSPRSRTPSFTAIAGRGLTTFVVKVTSRTDNVAPPVI